VQFAQGWPWARASWATALGLTSKLGLIPKSFKTLIILKGLKNKKKIIKKIIIIIII
jgi:hypothetical protein